MKNILLLAALLLSLHCFSQVPNYVSTNGLVAYWPFNGNANDASGNGNNGTVNGATLTSDRYGGGNSAYYFSNSTTTNSSYIQENINTATVNTNGAMTLSFWIQRVGDGYLGARVMEWGSCTTCPGQILVTWVNGTTTMTLRHYLTATSFVTYSFTNMSTGNWYHIVYTNDGTTANFYLNGSLVNTTASPAPVQLSGNTSFGRMNHPSNDAFNGDLDDIGLWNRALSACEVYSLYSGNPSSSFAFNPLQDTTTICDSITLDAGAGYTDYTWNVNGTISEDPDGERYFINQPGWTKITVVNTNGCSATDSTYINIIKPTIVANKTSICIGDSVTLNATGISGSSQTLIDNFTISALVHNTHTVPTIIGMNYIMSVSGIWSVHFCTDPNNVSDAAYYYERTPITSLPNSLDLVTWNGLPVRPDGNAYTSTHIYNYTLPAATQTTQTFSFTDPSDVPVGSNPSSYSDNCGGLSYQIYQVNKSNASYSWSANPLATAGLNAANIHQQNITANPSITTTYYATVNDGVTSCEDSIKITVAAIDTSLTVQGATTACSGKANVSLTAGMDNSYKWLLNSNAIIGATTSNYVAKQAGAYSVAVTNSNGCIDTSRIVNITLYPQPYANFTVNNNAQCLSNNSFAFTNLSGTTQGNVSYLWNFGDGQQSTSINPSHTYTEANTYTVKLIVTGQDGSCEDSSSNNAIMVNSSPTTPTITAGGPLTFCENGDVVLTSDTVSGNQWYKDGVIINGATNQTYKASVTGTYSIIATANTCASSFSKGIIITVNPTPASPIINAGGPTSFCENDTVLLIANTSSGNQWFENGKAINGAINQTYSASAAGIYTVTTTINTCISNASPGITVTINPATPTPVITAGGPISFCESGSVVLTSSAATGNQWYQDGILTSTPTGNTYTVSSAGVYTVIATADNSCPSNISSGISITIIPSPQGIRYDAVNASVNTPITLQARNFGEAYSWTPAIGLDELGIASPIFSYNETTDYIIRITTSTGCYTYDSVLVNVYNVKGILVPTAFSPNGDGLNDILTAFPIGIKQLNYFRIFNKWGQLIFDTNNPAIGWDGTYKGIAQPIGNYVWIAQGIDNDGKVMNEHGQTVLIR